MPRPLSDRRRAGQALPLHKPIAGLRIELRSSGYEPDRGASPSHPQHVGSGVWGVGSRECSTLRRVPRPTPYPLTPHSPAQNGPAWNRTTDLPHVTRALWPLSYGPNTDRRSQRGMFPGARGGLTAGKDSRPKAGSLSDDESSEHQTLNAGPASAGCLDIDWVVLSWRRLLVRPIRRSGGENV